MSTKSPFVVSTHWLNDHLNDENLSIIDASWYLPAMGRDGVQEFEERRIPGATIFDVNAISEPGSSLPHTFANADHFAAEVGKIGITHTDTIVIYDGVGLFSAARVWWNFRVMGVKNVFLLDGGFPQWEKDGYPIETTKPSIAVKKFVSTETPDATVPFAEMKQIVAKGTAQIADARPAGRFTGEQPEPREGMRSGHMPGATSMPASALSADGKLHDLDTLRDVLETAGIDLSKPVVTTCGSGVTAAIISLALQSIGHTDNRIYDGSWSEWGARSDTDIVTG